MSGRKANQKIGGSNLRNMLIEVVSIRRSRQQNAARIEYAEVFQSFQKFALTENQVTAAVSHAKETLVVAGAGSGKTSLLLGRAKYLIESGRATPEQILILAFNKKAAVELTERATALGIGITAMTFHAFGKSVLEATGDSRTVVFTENHEIDQFYATEFEKLKASPSTALLVSNFLAHSLIPHRENESFDGPGELAAFIRSLPRTLNGEKVKSHGEWMIANFLWTNNVAYGYERKYSHGDPRSVHKPDFHIDNTNIYIEYFGIDDAQKTAPWIDNEQYLKSMIWKRSIHDQNQSILIELTYGDLKSGLLLTKLDGALKKHRISTTQKSDKEVFDQANARRYQLRLMATFTAFHQHVRARRPDLIALNTAAQFSGPRNADFVALFLAMYKSYLQRLAQLQQPDFSDLIHGCADLIDKSVVKTAPVIQELDRLAEISKRETSPFLVGVIAVIKRFVVAWRKLRRLEGESDKIIQPQIQPILATDGTPIMNHTHLMVDEFQDISYDRYRLIEALGRLNPQLETTFVGDDWQAIYSFAGSDIAIMRESATSKFGRTRVDLGDTFRLPQTLADAATAFITQNPSQLRKNISSTFDKSDPLVLHWDTSSASENSLKNIEKVIGRIGIDSKNADRELQVIARYKDNLPSPSELSKLWAGPITVGSIHSVKGLESDYVIVTDLKQDFRGFPSTILDDPVIRLIVPISEDFKYAEERRLFYVALTRARIQTHLICPTNEPSVFAVELLNKSYGGRIFGKHYGETDSRDCTICGDGRLVLNKFGNYICSSSPVCDLKLPVCGTCKKYMRLTSVSPVTYTCQDHTNVLLESCPECDLGTLVEKAGRNGSFTSCHLWSVTGCSGKSH